MKKIIGVLLTLAITVIAVIFFSGFAMAAQVTEIIKGHGRIHINGGVDDGFVVGATVCFSVHSSEGHTCGTVVSAEASRAIVKVPSKAARRMRKGTEAILIVEKEEKKVKKEKEDKKEKTEIKEMTENKDKEKEEKKVKKEDWFR